MLDELQCFTTWRAALHAVQHYMPCSTTWRAALHAAQHYMPCSTTCRAALHAALHAVQHHVLLSRCFLMSEAKQFVWWRFRGDAVDVARQMQDHFQYCSTEQVLEWAVVACLASDAYNTTTKVHWSYFLVLIAT
jgi:hypothetical protein